MAYLVFKISFTEYFCSPAFIFCASTLILGFHFIKYYFKRFSKTLIPNNEKKTLS